MPADVQSYAPLMTRFVQYVIDMAAVYALALLLALLLGISGLSAVVVTYGVGGVIAFVYFWAADSSGGTIGRRLMGLRLVDDQGNAPTSDMVFVRTLIFFETLLLPILHLPFLFSISWSPFSISSSLPRTGQGTHDLFGATYVVRSATSHARPQPRQRLAG